MSDLTIVTNNVPRDILDAWELTADERAQFDYHDWAAIERGEDSASFFRYKGDLYDLGEFTRLDGPFLLPNRTRAFATWDGYQSDTFFSGTLVRYCDDFERVVVGRFYG